MHRHVQVHQRMVRILLYILQFCWVFRRIILGINFSSEYFKDKEVVNSFHAIKFSSILVHEQTILILLCTSFNFQIVHIQDEANKSCLLFRLV